MSEQAVERIGFDIFGSSSVVVEARDVRISSDAGISPTLEDGRGA